jgi:hypothetical protein
MTTYVKLRGPAGCDECNQTGYPAFHPHDDGSFIVPQEVANVLLNSPSGFILWPENAPPVPINPIPTA